MIGSSNEVDVDIVQALRVGARRGADISELIELLPAEHNAETALLPALRYFRAAFQLSLREALPLREWLSVGDRSEVDSLLLPAIRRWTTRNGATVSAPISAEISKLGAMP